MRYLANTARSPSQSHPIAQPSQQFTPLHCRIQSLESVTQVALFGNHCMFIYMGHSDSVNYYPGGPRRSYSDGDRDNICLTRSQPCHIH